MYDAMDDQADEQKIKIFKLMEQIKQQQMLKRQNQMFDYQAYGYFDPNQFVFPQQMMMFQQNREGYQTEQIQPQQDVSVQQMPLLTEEQIAIQARVVETNNGVVLSHPNDNYQQTAFSQRTPAMGPSDKELEQQIKVIQLQTETLKHNLKNEDNLQHRIQKLKQLQDFQQQ